MSVTRTLPTAAVDALVALLPSATLYRVAAYTGTVPARSTSGALVASFVGATSADLALVLTDTSSLDAAAGTDSPLVSSQDVLRPALDGAAATLGIGVLGDVQVEDASALFADDETNVFQLTGDGVIAGWFAIRLRENGTVNGSTGNGSTGSAPHSVVGKLGRINNVEMALTVEIGRARMSVRDVLALEPGAVIELDRSAGAPADVLLNGRLIAHGEIVVVDQDYAVRITNILDVAEGIS